MSALSSPPPIDLGDIHFRNDPYPTYRWYREHSPVYRVEPRHADSVPRYLLTRWSDVEAGLKNPALKRTIDSNALWNQPLEQVPPELRTYARITREWPLFRDPPQHASARRPINRVMEETRKDSSDRLLTNILEQTLDDLRGRESFDAAEDYARRLVLQLNLAMLGIEEHDWKELGEHLQNISFGLGNVFDLQRLGKASRSMETIEHWMDEAAHHHLVSPSQKAAPFLERLLAMESAGIIAGREQLAAAAILLVQAGQDTTSALLANAILTVLRHPAVLTKLIEESDFAPRVVEEVLRYESPVQQITRHASEPIEIRGVKVSAGEGVSFLLGAANRDPEIFNNPEEFDPSLLRSRTAAFGFGPHGCPGATFGRETVAKALQSFFQRFPSTRLTSESISWKPLVTFRSVAELLVTP